MSGKRMTVLAIDDDLGDAELLRRNLEEIYGPNLEFIHSVEPAQAQRELTRHDIDITFLDYQLGSHTGLELLQTVRSAGDLRPLVVLTGHGDEYVAAHMSREGADEYIAKADLSPKVLERAITNAHTRYKQRKTAADLILQRETLTRAIMEAHAELRRRSRVDPLTGLLNRGAWTEAAELEHKRFQRNNRVYSILMIDLDHFKDLNDSLGHRAGDQCLQAVSRSLQESSRATDHVGRYGGEEFVILAPETSTEGALKFAESIRQSIWDLNLPHPKSPIAERVTLSIGVASAPSAKWESVLYRADLALYSAKRGGRNRVATEPIMV